MRVLLVALLLLAAAGRAAADPPDAAALAEAERFLREGNAHYAAGRHDAAIAAYQRAHDLTGAPGFLYNIAQVHRVAGRCRQAIDHYERFLAAEPRTPLRPKVERFVAELWRCVETERRATQSRREPLPEEEAEPRPARGADPLAAATPARTAITASASPEPARPGHPRLRWTGAGLAAAGVLAIASGIYFGLEARAASQDVEDFSGEWGPAQERREAEAARDERNAVVLTSVGGAALAGGLALFVWAGSF